MATLNIIVKDSNEAFGLKMKLDSAGLVRDHDYTWKYNPRIDDWLNTENNCPASVDFTFSDPAMATFYKLKWS